MAGRQCAERGGEPRVNCGLHEDFDDLVATDAKVFRGADVIAQLRDGAKRSERRDRRDLTAPEIERLTRVKVAEWKFDRHAREIGGDFGDPAGHELLEPAFGELVNDIHAPPVAVAHLVGSEPPRRRPSKAASPSAANIPPIAAGQPKRSNSWPMVAAPASPPK